ncbi:MAG: hypothetical protein CMF31_00970 [Kordiimonas sp.]|nr:hypothetical protein [Kordiimonas sp.]|tara:strand:+ start:445 stop:3540 length:3096 start_codon:yes stop_codon:yes gene_type:complete
MPLFHPRVIEKHIKHIKHLEPMSASHADILSAWAENLSKGIYDSETQNDGEFIQRILIDVLGYVGSSEGKSWTVAKNQPLPKGNVDVALGSFTAEETKIIAPFELKGAKTKDLDAIMAGRNKSPVQQAWEYASDIKGAQWVLVSNYREIRLYAFGYGRKDYEFFDLSKLSEPKEYARFILLLSAESLLNGKTQSLLKESEQVDKDITNQLYADYKALRAKLIKTIGDDNPDKEPLQVIRYTQTILDRILFVAFAEDKGLLPENTLKQAYETKNLYSPQPVWENFKGLFQAINKGNPDLKIPAYNGGLFKDDAELNNLSISDALCEGFKKIGDYDFDSDVSVNILGHIFEQSISDLEELKAHAENVEEVSKNQSKRKKDGIFYTPAYITRYIVEQAVGGWLNDRREELGINTLPVLEDADYDSIKVIERGQRKGQITYNKKIEKHIQTWEAYKEALSKIKVLDPACGSGAFLNEVFDYLKNEGEAVNSQLALLKGEQTTLFRWDTHILANNIYGVDLNSESVEITKLSLWLKTANRQEKLTYLEDNIKVGNSLIDDPEIAGDLAFDWNKQFSEIMQNGGFDVIVGNPPYVFARDQGFTDQEKQHYYANYEQANYQINTYALFTEKGYRLAKSNGYLGYIIPNTCLTINSFKEFRKFILEETSKTKIINIFDKVFSDASVDCCILLFKKEKSDAPLHKGTISKQELSESTVIKSDLSKDDYIINLSINSKAEGLLVKINNQSDVLDNVATVKAGLQAYEVGKGNPIQTKEMKNERVYHSFEKVDGDYLKYVDGKDVCRYYQTWGGEFLKYGENLASPRNSHLFNSPRILVRQIPSKPPYCINACYLEDHVLNDRNSMNIVDIQKNPYFVLGLLNSRLVSYWFVNSFDKFQRKTFPQFKINELKKFPIHVNGMEEIATKAKSVCEENSQFIKLIETFEKLLKTEFRQQNITTKLKNWFELEVSEFIAEIEKSIKPIKLSLSQKAEWMEHFEKEKAKALELKNKIDQTDREIDQMVYELYQLTPEDIALVENGST